MARSPYDLPPLTMLRAFEAAARLGAFNEAAGELNVTPGAISHNIKALERELGCKLFRRGHRQVTLTADGGQLYEVVSRGFSEMGATVRRLRRNRDGDSVDIAVTTAFSHLWLTPRLVHFWQDNQSVQVNQRLSDGKLHRPLTTDLAIIYSDTPPSDTRHRRLFSGDLTPICGPGLAGQETITSLERLAAAPLILLEADNPSWLPWPAWFRLAGYDGPLNITRRVNSHSIAIQLAEEGAGIALGWRKLIETQIATGRLIALDQFSVPAPGAFYLISAREHLTDAGEAFFHWLGHQVR